MLSGLFIKHFIERENMDIALTAPHIDVIGEQKFYLEKRINKLDRFIMRPIYCRVALNQEKNDFVSPISLSVPRDTIFVKGLSNDQTRFIDDAVDKLVTRVVKFKETRFSRI